MNVDCGNVTSKTASTKIPTPLTSFRRSASVRIRGDKANLSSSVPVSSTIDEYGDYNSHSPWVKNYGPLKLNRSRMGSSSKLGLDDDLESIGSVASNFSVATTNSTCEHVNFAKNGTTYSGRSHKYIVHCSSGCVGQEEYLTPTQRANRSIKKLKSLLELAREKLREKEEEIFRLNKEVVELKTYKTTVESSSPGGVIDHNVPSTSSNGSSKLFRNFINDTFGDLSPIKNVLEDNHNLKMSPSSSQDGMADKTSITPDILFSSMADSGNFDDLPSSASVYSKESINVMVAPNIKQPDHNQNDSAISRETGGEEDKIKMMEIYERKLDEKRLEYEFELSRVMNTQEEKNMKIIRAFEDRLKEEELKFESRWNELVKSTEQEKLAIVNRFEEKLEEERQKYRESLDEFKANKGKSKDMVFETTYCKNVDEEKTIYETALMDMKQKFETEKQMIEKKFDDTMTAERDKFEDNLKTIKQICDSQVADLTEKVSHFQTEYSQLLPKYEKAVLESEKLERENESLKETLKQQEENHRKMFLTIYKKGQEAARIEMEAQQDGDLGEKTSKKVSMPELFAQLKITEVELENLKAMYKRLAEAQAKPPKETGANDPEATLQFLKSAVYYFLTDRENHLGHLKAIESILAFSSTEKSNIEKLYLNRY